MFRPDIVDGFDLDPRMVSLAKHRLSKCAKPGRLWVGNATPISAANEHYDAVFDFGALHHVPRWRGALTEVSRVLKPGGRFFGEEVLAPFFLNPIVRAFFRHPPEDRFDGETLKEPLVGAGLDVRKWICRWNCMAWFVAAKDSA